MTTGDNSQAMVHGGTFTGGLGLEQEIVDKAERMLRRLISDDEARADVRAYLGLATAEEVSRLHSLPGSDSGETGTGVDTEPPTHPEGQGRKKRVRVPRVSRVASDLMDAPPAIPLD